MKRDTLIAINSARRDGRAIVRATDLATGDERLIDPATDTSLLGLAAAGAAHADMSGPADIEGRPWFLSVFNPPLDLVIVGRGAYRPAPLSRMAREAELRHPRDRPAHGVWRDGGSAFPTPRSAMTGLDEALDEKRRSAAARPSCS